MLAGKLVPIVVIHSLGGSRANWHHTPNPQPGAAQPTQEPGAAQPTQDEDPQVMHNPPELPLALHQGRHKSPSQSQ